MPDKFVTNFKVAGEIIKVKDENLNGTVNEIISGNTELPYVKRTGDTMTGNLNMGTYKITNIPTPTDGTDATNKTYVDSKITSEQPQIATETVPGIVKAAPATGEDIQDVRITPDGFLKTKASTGGGGSNITVVQTTGISTADVMSQNAVTSEIQSIQSDVQTIRNGLPLQATDTVLGTVKAAPTTADDTQDVHITTDGHLKTKPSGGTPPTIVQNTGTSTTDIMSQNAVTNALNDKVHHARLTIEGSYRDAAYVSSGSSDIDRLEALSASPPDPNKPIILGQIARYCETNQTYNPNDVRATLLVTDPHSDMEAVNKRTNDGKLAKANINDGFKRVTAVRGSNPGTESYHIITKTTNEIAEDRIPMYNENNDINVPLTPTTNQAAASKKYVDDAIANATNTQTYTTLPATNTPLANNALYNIPDTSLITTYTFVPPNNDGWAHGFFITGGTTNITFAAGSYFTNKQPTFDANTKYEFDVYMSTWAFAKVVTA